MSDLTHLSISDLRTGLAGKKFSSRELTQTYLDKIDKTKELNAFILVDRDKALAAADQADKMRAAGSNLPLLGIPGAIKDMILTKDVRTTAASKILQNFVPPYSATVVNRLEAAGSIVLGKTNLDEFAMGSSNENSAFGAVKNPWDIERVPGGSSGGSAAAIAACLAPYALGTDTGGSIRQPASFCNIVGIKPTYGRVSRYGVVAYASSLDQVGPMARTVQDCAEICQVLSGHDEFDSTSVDKPVPQYVAGLKKGVKGLRLGIPKEYFIKGLDPEVEKAVRGAIKQLESLGATTVEISLPHTELAVAVYYILAPAEASSNLARYDGVRYGYRAQGSKDLMDLYCRSRSEGFGQEVQRRIMIGTYVLSSGYFDAFYLKAQKVRTLIAQDFQKAFAEKCDVIVSPTAPTTAFRIAEKVTDPLAMYLNDIFTIPVNLAGLPGMSLPCGFDSKGLPIGLQLIGKPWDEETLFNAGFAYESGTEWHKRLPEMAKV
ncbi:MAG: Asp-tRNA(Asn)/Glu-tRNA(Gln) amidotransferase subunit GatA [Oligoflexia bacterium]|nr:Asp-tRNA(Asn)/Glu-tRNA(Gln) amidotransferase subunit GatA [Oligoflexia bacterium]